MTLAEIAKYLGVHPMTIYRMLKAGRLPGFKLGRQWRTKKDVLDAWLVAQMPQQRQPSCSVEKAPRPVIARPEGPKQSPTRAIRLLRRCAPRNDKLFNEAQPS